MLSSSACLASYFLVFQASTRVVEVIEVSAKMSFVFSTDYWEWDWEWDSSRLD